MLGAFMLGLDDTKGTVVCKNEEGETGATNCGTDVCVAGCGS